MYRATSKDFFNIHLFYYRVGQALEKRVKLHLIKTVKRYSIDLVFLKTGCFGSFLWGNSSLAHNHCELLDVYVLGDDAWIS